MKHLLMLLLVAGSGGFVLSACSLSGSGDHWGQNAERIYGVRWQGNILFVDVISHGCTSSDDFSLHWRDERLLLQRDNPDRCRRMPFVTTLNFETARFPGQFVTIENPISENP